jgi:hypothetical protein
MISLASDPVMRFQKCKNNKTVECVHNDQKNSTFDGGAIIVKASPRASSLLKVYPKYIAR